MSILYPLCEARKCLKYTDGGPRVVWMDLMYSFTPAEWARWERESNDYPVDEFGMNPEPVERFLTTLEATMAATTKERTAPRKRGRAKKAEEAVRNMDNRLKEDGLTMTIEANGKSATLGAAAGDASKNDPNQPPLPGMEDMRIPAIERLMARIVKRDDAMAAVKLQTKQDNEKDTVKIGKLLRDNKLESYQSNGKIAYIKHGIDAVEIKKAPAQKK